MNQYGKRLQALAILLACLAGFVDAIGFLSIGGYFTSFMTGNTTRMAVGLVETSQAFGIAGSLVAAFVLGVICGALVSGWLPDRRKPAVLALVSAALAISAGLKGMHFELQAVMISAWAMGALNNVFQRNGEVTIAVSYMTGTLVRMGQKLALALRGGDRWAWLPYGAMWLALTIGVVLGAVITLKAPAFSYATAALCALTCAGLAFKIGKSQS
jgi:uncharacterized membrane protein YoaK (UPF0700 family)